MPCASCLPVTAQLEVNNSRPIGRMAGLVVGRRRNMIGARALSKCRSMPGGDVKRPPASHETTEKTLFLICRVFAATDRPPRRFSRGPFF
jgi:hypothetical protein